MDGPLEDFVNFENDLESDEDNGLYNQNVINGYRNRVRCREGEIEDEWKEGDDVEVDHLEYSLEEEELLS
ncbi:Hypothetical predicted protein [Olea europaea subsp. europaea]|uniref:Uncharacterized protein n=1 Tax=Olea europaea subsp. europaea TaxID=158383 RepID=A0A8S0PL78_OLEEU|nr:Hypothetical predicted protein [Olea europaea subsp. europaea]